jgi:hypothetical protein
VKPVPIGAGFTFSGPETRADARSGLAPHRSGPPGSRARTCAHAARSHAHLRDEALESSRRMPHNARLDPPP